jgi:hypothetical protein
MSARFGSSAAGCDSLWYRMSPGSNRFDLSDRVYIGEADRLRRRFQHYPRGPWSKTATNLRLNSVMAKLLGAAGTIEVWVITSTRVEVDGHAQPLDLRPEGGAAARRDCRADRGSDGWSSCGESVATTRPSRPRPAMASRRRAVVES